MRYVRRSKLFEKVLRPLEEQLARLDYVGNVDVNCIVDEDGHPWPLEFTMRCGWPSTNIEQRLMNWDFIEFLAALAAGEPTRGAHIMDMVAVGTVLMLPPYPNPPRDYEEIVGVPMFGDIDDNWHSCEMQAIKDGDQLASAGGYLGIATGVGTSVREAAKKSRQAIGKLSVPASPFWRNDIGKRLQRDLPKLHEFGFATGLEY